MLQVDQTRVELEFERVQLTLKLIKDFLALIGNGVLISSACCDISAQIIDLIPNITVQFTIWTTEEVNSFFESAKLVINLRQSEVI